MANTHNEIEQTDAPREVQGQLGEIQELSKKEMEDVTGGGTEYEYDFFGRLATTTTTIGGTR